MAAATDLVALVDAVDELRVGRHPRETDSRGVDRLGLHVTGGDGGHWEGRGGGGEGERGETEGEGKKIKYKGVRAALS